MKNVEIIESFGKLEINDGDVVVLKTDRKLSMAAHEQVKNSFADDFEKWGFKNIRIMILEDGLDIGILRKSDVS